MGIDASLAFFLATTARRFAAGGSICTLGVQELRSPEVRITAALQAAGLTPAPGRRPFFERLGFDAVESLDVSPFEGCTHLVDLNEPGVPEPLRGRYDAVYNGGTLEHVFDVRNALRNIHDLLRVDGLVIHIVPTGGWLDHGFYQICPTLLTDYYGANGYELLEATLLDIVGPGRYRTATYRPGAAPRPGRGAQQSLFYACVRKLAASTWHVVPRQRYYAAVHGSALSAEPAWVHRPPFTVCDGVPDYSALPLHALPAPRRGEGHEWTAPLPALRHLADGPHGSTSPLLLFEDGEPIGPAHAPHADIRRRGGGRYSHWDGTLHFSTSRNGDARGHSYSYAVIDADSSLAERDRHLLLEHAP
jgi:hypothetical protein